MASPDANKIYDGLSMVAHAIRRSAALYVAMSILPPDSTIDDLKDQADDLAQWVGGNAVVVEGEKKPWQPPTD